MKHTLALLTAQMLAPLAPLIAAESGRVPPLSAPKRLILNDDGHNGFYVGKWTSAAT